MSPLTGAKQVITGAFIPDECLDLVEKESVSIMHGFEAHLKGLTEAQEKTPRDVSSLRTGIFAAGMHSATPVVRHGARTLAPLKNLSGFGMTECWLGVSLNALDDSEEKRCETSGYPGLGYQVRVADPETGLDQPVGISGEILVKGYKRYLGDS